MQYARIQIDARSTAIGRTKSIRDTALLAASRNHAERQTRAGAANTGSVLNCSTAVHICFASRKGGVFRRCRGLSGTSALAGISISGYVDFLYQDVSIFGIRLRLSFPNPGG